MLTPISKINIGTRIREDMGDIAGLAESIQARGLLHPIIIDEAGNLIAGHRRLEAHKLLCREEIETRTMADLSEKEKRLIELEENTKRKALTEFEASKNLMELANATKEVLREEFLLPSSNNSSEHAGRPQTPDSEEKVAERLGISRPALNEAKRHVAAVEQFPALEALPKKEAIKTAKDSEKAEQYQQAVKEFPQLKESKLPVEATIRAADNLRKATPEAAAATLEAAAEIDKRAAMKQQLIEEQYRQAKMISNLVDLSGRMPGMVSEENMTSWLETCTDRTKVEISLSQVQRGISELQRLESKLKEALKGPRKVAGKRG